MTADVFIFWFLAFITVVSALSVVIMTNPVYCALSLVMTMVSIAGLFVTLQAYFLAGVQLIVYAGAVMVLFVMVLMLFDLKHELQAFSRGRLTGGIKLASVGILSGLIVGAVGTAAVYLENNAAPMKQTVTSTEATKPLAEHLFLTHVFSFEALGVLLLVIAVGAVALSRSKGGTHVGN